MLIETRLNTNFATANQSVCQGSSVTITINTEPYSRIVVYNNGDYIETVFTTNSNTSEIVLNDIQNTSVISINSIESFFNLSCNLLNSVEEITITVNPTPTIVQPANLIIFENPYDGIANFDLTTQTATIESGQNDLTINYFTNNADALTNSNPILNTSSFSGTNGQQIWVRIDKPSLICSKFISFTLIVQNSDYVYIPDNSFKTKLLSANSSNTIAKDASGNFASVDTNSNGEIEFSEALNISYLDVSQSNIADMTGLSSFTNLNYLDCRLNLVLNNLDVSNLTSLTYLNAYYAGLTSLTLTPSIVNLDISANSLNGSLDLTSFANLQTFKSGPYNGLTSLNLSGLTNLISVDCSYNSLTNLNVAGCSQLQSLICAANLISNFSGSGLTSLVNFDCKSNQIPSLDVSTSANLQSLDCGSNLIASLDVSSNPNLSFLDCNNNNLSTLDVTNCLNLQTLYFYTNTISSINLLNNTILQNLYVTETNLTSLDLSNNSFLNYVEITQNPQLTYLSLKNGGIEEGLNLSINPNLQFVCADDNEIENVILQLNIALLENVVVNSYCSFTPGGDFNSITGTTTVDGNNNGCDTSDVTMPYLGLNVSINGVSTNSSVFTNGVGIYNLYSNLPGIYQLTANLENPTYFNTTAVDIDSNTINNSTIIQNICITPNGSHPDVEVVLAPITPARPGFDATYEIVYKNKGNQTLSGTVTFNYNEVILEYVSATIAPTSQASGSIDWTYSNLQPFENRSIGLVLNVNSPVETPAVNINDVLNFTTSISPIVGDEIPSDNTFVFNQTVVGSYDPNDITCLEGDILSPSEIGNFLHYNINFENTGNFYAENVVVQELIDTSKFDITSLQILYASHAMATRINGNKVEFVFENINLAEAAGNPPVGGHGNVLFKIKSKDNLVANDFVQKTAKIFFDYNAPIETNIAQTTFQLLNNPIVEFDNSVKIAPNPTNSIVTIESEFTIESYELYDVQGRILEKSFENSTSATLDVSARQNGIYFLKTTTEKGNKIVKIVKK